MPNLPRLLCDTPAVVGAHMAGVWTVLTKQYPVAVTGTVVQEAQFYYDAQRNRRPINLQAQITNGVIECFDAAVEELKALDERLEDRMLAASLDPGELEVLALLVERRLPHLLCTGDGPAIRALCHLGMEERAISLERALRQVGQAPALRSDLTEAAYQRHRARGIREREDLA
jgi:hypothetical protein